MSRRRGGGGPTPRPSAPPDFFRSISHNQLHLQRSDPPRPVFCSPPSAVCSSAPPPSAPLLPCYPLSAIRYPLSAFRFPLSAIRFPVSAFRVRRRRRQWGEVVALGHDKHGTGKLPTEPIDRRIEQEISEADFVRLAADEQSANVGVDLLGNRLEARLRAGGNVVVYAANARRNRRYSETRALVFSGRNVSRFLFCFFC